MVFGGGAFFLGSRDVYTQVSPKDIYTMAFKIIPMNLTSAEVYYVVSCRIPHGDAKHLDDLVETGDYMNRSDVLRTALRNMLKECGE